MHSDRSLAFLDGLFGSRAEYYRTSKWLTGDFESDIWAFAFEDAHLGDFQIDFNVHLSDGTLLSDPSNRRILNTFKYWINACTHTDCTKGRGVNYSSSTAKLRIDTTLSVIDYVLLNDEHLGILDCGLEAINEDHLKQFVSQVVDTNSIAESIYDWSSALKAFLLSHLAGESSTDFSDQDVPGDVEFDSVSEQQAENGGLDIPVNTVPMIRRWLWKNGFYRKSYKHRYLYIPNLSKLARAIYGKTTLRGSVGKKPFPSVLGLTEVNHDRKEYPAVPVHSADGNSTCQTRLLSYKSAFQALRLLHAHEFEREELSLPSKAVLGTVDRYIPEHREKSRFRSLPTSVVLAAIEAAVTFHINYAENLHQSFDNLLKELKKFRQRAGGEYLRVSKLLTDRQFAGLMHPQVRELGVQKWSLSKVGPDHRFRQLRDNRGLSELIRVYYGGTAIVLGALMARRQSELMSLDASTCIDSTGQYLVFEKSKSTSLLDGRRTVVARPIDAIAVEMTRTLVRFQESLIKHGFLERKGKLFDAISTLRPDSICSVEKYQHTYNANIDIFCDYFQMPLWDGRRYYIRTHQLRRFFALSFFWGSGFGGMDTLRWFLGHTDPEHLYRYITENCPGEVLRHAKTQFLAETLEDHEELTALIEERYGTEDFIMLHTEELEQHIDQLLIDGTIEVEPDFLDDAAGGRYKIVVIVKEKRNHRG